MQYNKEIVIVVLMGVIFILATNQGRVVITGNTILDAAAAAKESAAAMNEVATNVQAIKQIAEEDQKAKTFCTSECIPEGRTCDKSVLTECIDFNFDGCLEFRQTSCMNGCSGRGAGCKTEPRPAKKSQSQILTEQQSILTNPRCSGKIIGTVQWNPHGSLCRKEDESTRSGGLIKPLDCCSKFYYEAECTQNLGIIRRGPLEYSQFFVIGCYEG